MADLNDKLLDAALAHVPFDGWSEASFEAAVAESELEPALAHGLCPRGAVDLAVAYHKRGDERMLTRLAQADLEEMRYSARVAVAVRYRLEAVEDKELVRRGATLFALPSFAPEGARLIWETCDAIWEALGDTSEDLNWYTKRATLSGVYSSAVLYWLGDTSEGHEATWAFLERRIDDVMKIEKAKHALGQNKLFGDILGRVTAAVRAPRSMMDMPGAVKK